MDWRIRRVTLASTRAAPWLELFGRVATPGWVVWGNAIEREVVGGALRELFDTT